MSYVIAVSNEKGGVAKTTTALSLGAIFAEAGHRVLLIDLDPQANLTLALGMEPGAQSITSSDI
jgi:chromosome partitioning protein